MSSPNAGAAEGISLLITSTTYNPHTIEIAMEDLEDVLLLDMKRTTLGRYREPSPMIDGSDEMMPPLFAPSAQRYTTKKTD